MIFGSYCLKGDKLFHTSLTSDFHNESIALHRVSTGCFNGGFYLNRRLPYRTRDVFLCDEKEDIIVLVSGTVYNRSELKEKDGIDEQATVPELISVMFRREGPMFVSKLNGDYVIFIGQSSGKQAYVFRDHLGIRPVAYYSEAGSLVFSSDINGLCRTLSQGGGIERDFLLGYFKYINYTKTPYKNVNRLLPGYFLRFSGAGLELTRYWDPGRIRRGRELNYNMMVSEMKSLLADAVSIRCDDRFTAGAHVSSGLDSGTVATLARKGYVQQEIFYGFSWSPAGFDVTGVKYDERDLVRTICEKAEITPVFMELTAADFIERLSAFYNNLGHFFEDRVMEQAGDRGVNLIFSGWGGDEFISTGDRGIETDLLTGLHFTTYFRRNPVRPVKRFIKYFLQYTLFPALGLLQNNVKLLFRNDARYIKKPFQKSDREAIRNFYFHRSRRQLHLRYLRFYHIQERCENWNVNGFRHGVEYRFPLLDKRIIEYVLCIPSLLLCQTDQFRPLLRLLTDDILPEPVRLNTSKKDPVYSAWWDELLRTSSAALMNEVCQWRNNSDLSFVDFDLLVKDIAAYRNDPESVDQKTLFRALVYLKAVNHFSLYYHAGNAGSCL